MELGLIEPLSKPLSTSDKLSSEPLFVHLVESSVTFVLPKLSVQGQELYQNFQKLHWKLSQGQELHQVLLPSTQSTPPMTPDSDKDSWYLACRSSWWCQNSQHNIAHIQRPNIGEASVESATT